MSLLQRFRYWFRFGCCCKRLEEIKYLRDDIYNNYWKYFDNIKKFTAINQDLVDKVNALVTENNKLKERR